MNSIQKQLWFNKLKDLVKEGDITKENVHKKQERKIINILPCEFQFQQICSRKKPCCKFSFSSQERPGINQGWCFCSDSYWRSVKTQKGLTIHLLKFTIT